MSISLKGPTIQGAPLSSRFIHKPY